MLLRQACNAVRLEEPRTPAPCLRPGPPPRAQRDPAAQCRYTSPGRFAFPMSQTWLRTVRRTRTVCSLPRGASGEQPLRRFDLWKRRQLPGRWLGSPGAWEPPGGETGLFSGGGPRSWPAERSPPSWPRPQAEAVPQASAPNVNKYWVGGPPAFCSSEDERSASAFSTFPKGRLSELPSRSPS